MKALAWFWSVIVLIALVLCMVYVWPTRYRYDYMRHQDTTYIVRIDRFTSAAEALAPGVGWVKQGQQ